MGPLLVTLGLGLSRQFSLSVSFPLAQQMCSSGTTRHTRPLTTPGHLPRRSLNKKLEIGVRSQGNAQSQSNQEAVQLLP